MNEFELIRKYFAKPALSDYVRVGIGDDCAVVTHTDRHDLVISMDTVVEGRHFLPGSAAEGIATRALCTALSDLAAMGAEPLYFTLALTTPEADSTWLEDFSRGLAAIAERFQCPLVGGDTTRGPLTVSVQVHGVVPKDRALLRAGARAGDHLFVSGCLGDGAAALEWLSGDRNLAAYAPYLEARFFAPEPELILGRQLVGLASAAMDISDGLIADLTHMCVASGVEAEIDVERLPVHPGWSGKVAVEIARRWAMTGGDDYRLLFTIPAARLDEVAELQLTVTEIGRIKERRGPDGDPRVNCKLNGQPVADVPGGGYRHFE